MFYRAPAVGILGLLSDSHVHYQSSSSLRFRQRVFLETADARTSLVRERASYERIVFSTLSACFTFSYSK